MHGWSCRETFDACQRSQELQPSRSLGRDGPGSEGAAGDRARPPPPPRRAAAAAAAAPLAAHRCCLAQGWKHFDRGNFKEARQAYNIAVQKNPDNPHCYHLRGQCYLMQGLYDEAMVEFSTAIKVNPRCAGASCAPAASAAAHRAPGSRH